MPARAYAERSVLTARTEITDRMLIFGERHLCSVLAEYEAPLQRTTTPPQPPAPPTRPAHPAADLTQERIRRRAILGNLTNEYEPAA